MWLWCSTKHPKKRFCKSSRNGHSIATLLLFSRGNLALQFDKTALLLPLLLFAEHVEPSPPPPYQHIAIFNDTREHSACYPPLKLMTNTTRTTHITSHPAQSLPFISLFINILLLLLGAKQENSLKFNLKFHLQRTGKKSAAVWR